MLIMALDPASTTGVCIGEPGQSPRLFSKAFKRDETDDPKDVFRRATRWLAEHLQTERIDHLAIEAPFPSQNFATSMISLGLFGIFTGIAGCKGIQIKLVQISSWRKYFLSNGRLSKEQAKRQSMQVCEAMGWKADGHDSAEAAGIWSWAVTQIAPSLAPRVEPIFLIKARKARA